MTKKMKMPQLLAAMEELNEVSNGSLDDSPIDPDLSQEDFEQELYDAYKDLVQEDDDFSEKTQLVWDYLEEKFGDEEEEEEEPEPVKKPVKNNVAKAPVIKGKKQPEPDEDEDEEDEEPEPVKPVKKAAAPVVAAKPAKKQPEPEPEEEDDEEADEEADLYSLVKETAKKSELLAIVDEYPEFKKAKKRLKEIGSVFSLKKEMLDIVGRPEEDEKPAAPKAAKKEITEKSKKTKGEGVVATIANLIINAGKKGISKEAILKELVIKFPERAEASMKSTVNLHVPGLMSKERFPIEKTKDGLFYKK